MGLSQRDRHILRLTDYFGQASTAQLAALVFPDVASRTSYDRTLRRLLADGYLYRIEKRRRTGGARGGSGEYIYSLGPEGWRICKREGRWHRRAVDYHALSIVDAYTRLMDQQRAGVFSLRGFTPEPECHLTVDGYELRPDAYTELERGGRVLKLWLEIDLGTERPARIADKLRRYVGAYRSGKVDPFPRVVFVTPDSERTSELAWIIKRRPEEEQPLFRVVEMASFPQV